MSRTVTALFDSRAEAEAARARLVSGVQIELTRMLAKDTAAAVHDLKLDPKVTQRYREALLQGDHLLVARVARGEEPKRIIQLLGHSTDTHTDETEAQQSYEIGTDAGSGLESETIQAGARDGDVVAADATDSSADDVVVVDDTAPSDDVVVVDAASPDDDVVVVDDSASPPDAAGEIAETGDEIRIGDGQAVAPKREHAELDNRGAERRLSSAEVEAAGLLKDRTIEVVEMREEPVIAKEVVVREEIIIRKMVNQRTETVRDVVRRTQVEVDKLPAAAGARKAARGSKKSGGRSGTKSGAKR